MVGIRVSVGRGKALGSKVLNQYGFGATFIFGARFAFVRSVVLLCDKA